MTDLIKFVDDDVQKIESNIVTTYEALAGYTLYPGDPRRLFLQALAQIIAHQRSLINYTGRQNLLRYAEEDYLKVIGEDQGVPQFGPSPAKTTLRFTISRVQQSVVTVPKGTRATADGKIFFATTETGEIPIGELSVDVPAECTVSGEIGNGFLPGQINRIVDPFPLFQSVMNVTESQGGADLEDTEIYRERIRQSNEGYSTAGPYEAYKYWAKMASPAIIDVEPMSPAPGVVQLWILMKNGESPTQDILDAVLEVCSDRTKRPLTDNVIVSAREEVNYDIEVLYWIDENDAARALEIQNAVHQAVADYELWQKSKLGRDIDPSELNYRIKQVGAKRVQINLPAYTKIESHQVAIAINKNVSYQGLEGE